MSAAIKSRQAKSRPNPLTVRRFGFAASSIARARSNKSGYRWYSARISLRFMLGQKKQEDFPGRGSPSRWMARMHSARSQPQSMSGNSLRYFLSVRFKRSAFSLRCASPASYPTNWITLPPLLHTSRQGGKWLQKRSCGNTLCFREQDFRP